MKTRNRYIVTALVFSMLAFILLASGCNSLETYSNSYFSVQYPSNWELQEISSWESDALYWGISPKNDFHGWIFISVNPGEPPVSLETACDTLVSTLENEGHIIIDSSKPPAGQWDWVVTYENVSSGDTNYWALKYETYYWASVFWYDAVTSEAWQKPERRNIRNQILDSFEFYYLYPSGTTSPAGFETYTDSTNGFSISVPVSWEADSIELSGNSTTIFNLPSLCAGQFVGVFVLKSDISDMSVETYYSEEVKPSIEDLDDFHLISKENLTIDGIPAIKVIFTHVEYEDMVQTMNCILIKQQTLWEIMGGCALTCWNTYEGSFNTMFSSFRLLD